MSWEIFAIPFKNGEPTSFNTARVREIFAKEALPDKGDLSRIGDFDYEDGYVVLYLDEDDTQIDGFTIWRFRGRTALKHMLEAAAALNCLLVWPASKGETMSAVADASTLMHLPASIRDDDPPPAVVRTVDDFIETVELLMP